MKLLIVSDSHGNKDILDKVLSIEYDSDYYFHLGDYELPDYLLNPFCAVRGNCDYLSLLPLEKDIEIKNIKIHIEHGDRFLRYSNKEDYILSKNCDIFLFGHIHERYANKINNTYIFNPGSISKPRDGNKGTYLIIILESNGEIKYHFKEIDL